MDPNTNRRRILRSSIAWLLLANLLPQTGSAQPPTAHAFSVASIRPNLHGNAGGEGSEQETITLSPGSLLMRNVSLRSCIRWAYDLRDSQISGPGWLGSQRFDIAATSEGPTAPQEMRQMLQKLLGERFKLAVRREAKDATVYAMTVNKEGKLRPATGEASGLKPIAGAMEFRNYSMAALAERLGARPFNLDHFVIDKTGLAGLFDFEVKFAENAAEMKHALEGMERGTQNGPSMIAILQDQLGFRFKAQKAPVSSLVVEHAERVPTEN